MDPFLGIKPCFYHSSNFWNTKVTVWPMAQWPREKCKKMFRLFCRSVTCFGTMLIFENQRELKKKMWIWLIDLQQLSLFLSDRKHIYVSIMWLEPWGLSTFIHYTRTIHYSAQDFILFHIFCTCMMQPFAVYGGLFISISSCRYRRYLQYVLGFARKSFISHFRENSC